MSRTKKPRNKAHRPKCPPGQIPVTIRFGADDERLLQLVPHLELDKLSTKTADDGTWHTVTARLNVGLVLSNNLFTSVEQTVLCEALDAMRAIKARFVSMGRWGGSKNEIECAHAGLVLTDDMQNASTRREQRTAIQYVYEQGGIP
jgi:hypothetical protein